MDSLEERHSTSPELQPSFSTQTHVSKIPKRGHAESSDEDEDSDSQLIYMIIRIETLKKD